MIIVDSIDLELSPHPTKIPFNFTEVNKAYQTNRDLGHGMPHQVLYLQLKHTLYEQHVRFSLRGTF